jgi:hypothetical protein
MSARSPGSLGRTRQPQQGERIGGRDQPKDVKKSADFCPQTLGEPADWKGQVGYPDLLALCVIDSIWS